MAAPSSAAADWSAVADAWAANVDHLEAHTGPATEELVRRVAPAEGERVLELAAGPGALGPRWSELVGPTGTVVLSDIAPRMVDVARARNAGLANVQVALLDLAAIDRPDDGFDVAACRMGLMFLPDPVVGLTEIRRVLRPGGRLGVLTWAGIEHNPWMTCVGLAAMAHGVVTGGPPVGPGEVFSLGDPAALADAGRQAGFLDVDVDELGMTFRSPSVEEHVERVSGLAAPLAAAFAAATADQLAGVRRTAAELASPYATDGGVAIPGRALLLTARA